MGIVEVIGMLLAVVVPLLLLGLLGVVVYHAVKAGVRNAARDATDEVIVRLLDYGWRPPVDRLPPEAEEIRRQEAQMRQAQS